VLRSGPGAKHVGTNADGDDREIVMKDLFPPPPLGR